MPEFNLTFQLQALYTRAHAEPIIFYFYARIEHKNTNFVGIDMQKLNLPEYSFSLKTVKGKSYIFDSLRKKYVRLTPEEWVRQNFVSFLLKEKDYSPSLVAVEASVNVNGNPQRADMIAFDRSGVPVLVAEFKAPEVKISQQTFDQVVRYNMKLKVKFLIVSNGMEHYCCSINYSNHSYSFLPGIPSFSDVNSVSSE